MKCTACGAQLGTTEASCAFCGVQTEFGREQQRLHQQQQAHAQAWQLHRAQEQAAQKRVEAERSLKRTADASMWWGIGGMVACCFAVPSVVAVVLGVRARKMARKYDLVIPTSATIGLFLGVLGPLGGGSLLALGLVQDYQREANIERIEQTLEGRLNRPLLEQRAACLLTQRSLLKGEFQDSNSDFEDFSCDGKLLVQDEKGVLEDVRFKRSGARHVVRVCLEKGERWSVSGFRLKNGCDEPDDTRFGSSSTPSATTSAADPSGAASDTTTP